MSKVERSNVTNNFLSSIERRWNFNFPKILRDYYTRYDGSEIINCEFERQGINFCVTNIIKFKESVIKKSFEEDNELKGYIYFAVGSDMDFYYWHTSTKKIHCLSLSIDDKLIYICDSIESFFDILNNKLDKEVKSSNINVEEKILSNNQKK